MKGFRKLLTAVLTAAMVMTMGMTAFAADNSTTSTGSITISEAREGQSYSIYRIFDFASTSDKNGTYTIDSKWSDFAKTTDAQKYFTVDSNGYVTATGLVGDEGAKNFATLALTYAQAHSISADATATATGTTVLFDKIPFGYYLSDSTLGASCALDTNTPNATFREKNSVPSITKEVQEDSDNSFGEKNDAQIGQTVNFKSVIDVKNGAESYVMHDKMSAGLSFTGITSITTDSNTTLVNGTDYNVTEAPADQDSFDVTFTDTYLKSVRDAGKDITLTVTYAAVLNGKASIGSTGNTNVVKLTYNNGVNTEEHMTTTYTYAFNLYKYASGDTTKTLAGAHFTLYANDGYHYDATKDAAANATANAAAAVSLVKVSDTEYRLATPADKNGVTDIVTTETTTGITINGLDADSYHLIETKAPAGYNMLTSDVSVQLTRSSYGDVTVSATIANETTNGEKVKVENKSGAILPHTGGIGTTIFYIIGGLMIIGAFVAFIVKRRMSAEK